MKVTVLPAHAVDDGLADIVTEGVTGEVTDIVTALEVTGLEVAHAADEVITQLTEFPLARVEEE